MSATKIQSVRKQLGYSADEVVRMVLQRALALSVPVMTAASLKTKLSRWENGHESISQPYRRLLRDVYGRTDEELGFPPDPQDEESDELHARLAVARSVDPEAIKLFRRQIDNARHLDRRFGGITLLDQLRSNITQLEGLLSYSTMLGQREVLAGVLTDASALAGWQALDRNALSQAWDHHERAKSAAREAGSQILLSHATAQQAFILIDLGAISSAVEQFARARTLAEHAAPALIRAWLAAAHGEGLAAAGYRDEAFRAFDAASRLLPASADSVDSADPALPAVFLAEVHLDRWRGAALSRLGEPAAINQLSHALPRLPTSFVRAKTGMLVDLAFAYAANGERDAALTYARQARRLASQIKSDRQLRRLSRLVLPGETASTA